MFAALLLALLMADGGGSPAAAKTSASPRATIENHLRAYKPDPALWQALGPGTESALIQIAGDTKVESLFRARAVSTLAYFPTSAARKFLEATIDAKATSAEAGDRLLAGKAAVALGWIGGVQVPQRLAPLLNSEDPELRLDAVMGLGLTRLPAAAVALRKRLDLETVARVRAQISRQIQVIEDARGPGTAPQK